MRSRYAKNDRHAKCAKRVVFSAASEVHEFHCKEACHSSSMHVLVHGDQMAHSYVRHSWSIHACVCVIPLLHEHSCVCASFLEHSCMCVCVCVCSCAIPLWCAVWLVCIIPIAFMRVCASFLAVNLNVDAASPMGDNVHYYICKRLKLEGETENMGVCTKARKGVTAVVLMATPCTNS